MQIRILIADDQCLFREGLRRLVEEVPELHVVGEVPDAEDVVELAAEAEADLVLMDIARPGNNSIQTIRHLTDSGSKTRVLVVSQCESPGRVREALRAGAAGYLSKSASARDLVAAIEAVRLGGSYLSPTIARRMARAALHPDQHPGPLEQLSNRELEVLHWLAEGLSSREIGARLSVSPRTVDSHRVRLMKKLDIHKVQGLVRLAIREGLIQA